MRYRIEIDDDDRQEEPERPWTANLYLAGSEESAGVSFGATPQEAVYELATSRLTEWEG